MTAAVTSPFQPGVYEQFESTTATKLNNEGAAHFQAGDFEAAISKYTLGISSTTENTELVALLSNRSFAYFNLRKFKEAQDDAEECLRCEPGYSKALLLLGKALQAGGNQVEACKIFYNAICDDDDHRDLLLQPLIDVNSQCRYFDSDVIDALMLGEGNSCKVCRQKSDLFRCSRCKMVHYCSREHQKKDWKTHKRRCPQLAEANHDMLELSSLEVSRDGGKFSLTMPFESLDCIKDWDQVWKHIVVASEEYKKLIGEYLSWPLTVISSICKFKLQEKGKLQIHVLGAKDFYIDHGLFTYFLEMFPLPDADITLIGPELSKKTIPLQYKNAADGCISLSLVRECYHDFTKQDDYVLPDLIVACHPGLSGCISRWAPTLRYIIMNDIPSVMTASSRDDFEKDIAVLKNEVYNTKILFEGDSLFPSPVKRLFRKTSDYAIHYRNSYWFGFKGGACLSDSQLQDETNKVMKEIFGGTASDAPKQVS